MDQAVGSSSRESEETGTSSFYTTSRSDTNDEETSNDDGVEVDYDDDEEDGSTQTGSDEDDDDDDDDDDESLTDDGDDNSDSEDEGLGREGDDDDPPAASKSTSDDNISPERATGSTQNTSSSAVSPRMLIAAATADKPQSEWDKALMQGKGKPSTGKAADFFNNHRRTRTTSTDSSTGGALHQLAPQLATTMAAASNYGASVANSSTSTTPVSNSSTSTSKVPTTRPVISIDVTSSPTGNVAADTTNADRPPLPPPPTGAAASAAGMLRSSTELTGGECPSTSTSTTQPLTGKTKGSVVVHVQQSSTNPSSTTANAKTSGSRAAKSNNHRHQQPPAAAAPSHRPIPVDAATSDVSAGVLPDVLMNMRQKIESFALFDSDMMRLAAFQDGNADGDDDDNDDPLSQESREALKRSSQQSISAAVLVSLAHKRYERRRLAAMEIEKVVRSLVALHQQHQLQGKNANNNTTTNNYNNTTVANGNTAVASSSSPRNELERIYAILLLLSDDFCRSTNEDARKGGTVALAACAIGLKRADDHHPTVMECRDLILASVVHACQDHSQRVRYYATESLFNVVKVIPSLAVQHFFILFEVLRSLFADVDPDVRSGAELLDKKLKEVIVGAMNAGVFTADSCVPVFGRFVYMRNKATKRLTLTWLQELNEKLIGAPILEFLHLFLGGVIEMVADPSVVIRQSALAFLQSVLPKLLVVNAGSIDDKEGDAMKVDFDKILQALVTTLEHANPFVRKVAMYWVSRIVKAHMIVNTEPDDTTPANASLISPDGSFNPIRKNLSFSSRNAAKKKLSPASVSVRNSVPHVLPGVLLSVGDNFVSTNSATSKDAFLPDQTTRSLAEQTNACLQDAVRRDGPAFVEFLDGFIVALREELASPGGFGSKNSSAVERTAFRMDVANDGTGIETAGWFRSTRDNDQIDTESMIMSRLCALHWVIVLYENVVPDPLKADYAREFVFAIIHQLADNPPETIVNKSLDVLARITVPVEGEDPSRKTVANVLGNPVRPFLGGHTDSEDVQEFPMTDSSVAYAMKILDPERRKLKSRDRQVFSALIQMHAYNEHLLANLSNVLTYMCRLQPPEFVMVSFAIELERFIKQRTGSSSAATAGSKHEGTPSSPDLKFLSAFVQHMNHVLLNADEAKKLREVLKDCISSKKDTEVDHQRSRLFHILLHSFSHNIVAALSLCMWAGAYRTASLFLNNIDPLDITLILLLEVDRLIELLERPLFRHLHVRMLERDQKPTEEGSGVMLFQLLKSLLMMLPQSTCYRVLRDRLVSVSRFRQSTIPYTAIGRYHDSRLRKISDETKTYVARVQYVRNIHCAAMWKNVRQESLEMPKRGVNAGDGEETRSEWLGYSSREEALQAEKMYRESQRRGSSFSIEEVSSTYHAFDTAGDGAPQLKPLLPNNVENDSAMDSQEDQEEWKQFWSGGEEKR